MFTAFLYYVFLNAWENAAVLEDGKPGTTRIQTWQEGMKL